jgi:hypothetical protein
MNIGIKGGCGLLAVKSNLYRIGRGIEGGLHFKERDIAFSMIELCI